MGKLDGKTVFLTGGARGQGRSHAVTLAAEGARIVMMDNLVVDMPYQPYPGGSPEQYEETQELLKGIGNPYLATVGDVRNTGDLDAAVKAAISEFGQIDIVVANAGVALGLKKIIETEHGAWNQVIDINLTGVFNTIKAVLPVMVAQRSGRVIATSSMGGRRGGSNTSGYTASKWGVIGLIKTVANEYGEYGITANCVCPTNVNSPMLHNQDTYDRFVPDVEHPTREQAEERMAAMHPMRVPYVEASDISQAILWLASDAARYVSGIALDVSLGGSASHGG
jgi:SDR family mycofactocin-dependent oxidoreductase